MHMRPTLIKLQTPSSKLQTPTPTRYSRTFGTWCLEFLWSLVFGAWSLLALSAAAQAPTVPPPPTSPSPPPQDPLLSLMISQPKIDISGPANPMAAFDPPVVRPGESSIYRVTLNALEQTIQ